MAAFRRMLASLATREESRVAFAVPEGASWPLPLYELVLMTAGYLESRGVEGIELMVVTGEPAPLLLFGERASEAVARLLAARGIALRTGAHPANAEDSDLLLIDGERIAVDRVVTLPRLVGCPIEGLPHDREGFLPVDGHGRVAGVDGVYGAGDLTTFPIKQGGIASQQADAAAEAILAQLGFPIEPRPFQPVLQGVLLTDSDPTYMRARVDAGESSEPRGYSLWWPPSKIAGRYLSPYLTVTAGAPRTPEVRPDRDVIPVEVDIDHAVRAVRGAVGTPADEAVPAS
jgi:sulfide:quinone oxidoreductase